MMTDNVHVQVKTESECVRLLWGAPSADVRLVFQNLMIYKVVVTARESQIQWTHTVMPDGRVAPDLLLIVYELSGEWVTNLVLADGLEHYHGVQSVTCTYTEHHMVSIRQGIKMAKHRLSVIETPCYLVSNNATSLPITEETCKAVCRSAMTGARTDLKEVAKKEYFYRISWPSPNVLAKAFFGVEDIIAATTNSTTICVFTILAHAPYIVSMRLAVISRGICCVVWNTKVIMLAATKFLEGIAGSAKLSEHITTTRETSNETSWIKTAAKAEELKQGFRRRTLDSSGRHPPRCIKDLYLLDHDWNNGIRWQLAYILVTLSRHVNIDPFDLAEPFIKHMESKQMSSRRIKHFKTHLKRYHVEDKQKCISRKSYGGAAQKSISCPYGGGRDGVRQCMQDRGITTHMYPETMTVSHMWMTRGTKSIHLE